MTNVIVDVKPRGNYSAYVVAPFDEGKEALESKGYRVISLEKNAGLRIQEGATEDVSRYGNWVREGTIYVPAKGAFLTKNSPIMGNAKEATDCHRNERDYYLTDEQVEQTLADSVKLVGESIPTNRFADNEIAVYAFGDIAKQYGQFLKENGIKEMPVWLADLQDKPFARQVWFWSLGDGGSVLGCDYRGLHGDHWVRGVCESAEGTSQKIEAYTLEDIQKTLKAKGLFGIEKILIDGLRNQ